VAATARVEKTHSLVIYSSKQLQNCTMIGKYMQNACTGGCCRKQQHCRRQCWKQSPSECLVTAFFLPLILVAASCYALSQGNGNVMLA
jgi:hypothetical protein